MNRLPYHFHLNLTSSDPALPITNHDSPIMPTTMASSLSARTVFLKLHPSARTFAERREVLRVMERFGEVTMFKSYKVLPPPPQISILLLTKANRQYSPRSPTPNTFLVLFASESAARNLVNASPVRYRLILSPNPSSFSPPLEYAPQPQASPPANTSTPSGPDPPTDESQSSPSTNQQTTNESEKDQQTAPSPTPSLDPKPQEQPYQLMAYPSYFSHTLYLRSPLHNPLHGPYTPIPTNSSYIASSLTQNVPSSIMTSGLLDWETDSRSGKMGFHDLRPDEPASGDKDGEMEGEMEGDMEEDMEGIEGYSRRELESYMGGEFGGDSLENEGSTARNAGFYFQNRQRRRAEKSKPGVMGGLRALRREYEAGEQERALEAEWEQGGGFARSEVDVK
jgi:hypothetical protein